MIFDFYPWKIDIDIEETKQFYQGNDYSENKEWNKTFKNNLNTIQQEFFEKLNIDLMKIKIVKHDFIDNEEVPYMFSVNFMFCGRFLSIPNEQLEIYMEDDIFGESVKDIKTIFTDKISYDGLELGTGIRFQHPAVYYEDKLFEKWDCGFICGTLIVRG